MATIVPVWVHPVAEEVVPSTTTTAWYPSGVTWGLVGFASPFAYFTAHSLAIVATVFAAAEALALLLILVNEGIAIADKIAKTATTTTSSMSEKPSSPGFFERAFLALGLLKYAWNDV